MIKPTQPTAPLIVTEERAAEERKKEYIGSLRVRPGHKLFKFKDGVIDVVGDDEYEDILFGPGKIKRSLVVDPDARYVSALNKKNAIKRLLRSGMVKVKSGTKQTQT